MAIVVEKEELHQAESLVVVMQEQLVDAVEGQKAKEYKVHEIDSVDLLANLDTLSPPNVSLTHLYVTLSPLPGKPFSPAYPLNALVSASPVVSPL